MSTSLYRWPAAAKFGRVVPKSKFYEYSSISASLREKFVREVQRIVWDYKLADETVHLRGSAAVPEIQVFAIDAKEEDVTNDVLTAIDKAIPFPLIFEINRETGGRTHIRMVAAHKQLGGTAQRLSSYLSTEWQSGDASRMPLPPALDLPGLYAGLLTPMLPIAPRPGEKMSETTRRMDHARTLERVIAALEKKLHSESQFNRKMEFRQQIRDQTAILMALTEAEVTKTEETQWKS